MKRHGICSPMKSSYDKTLLFTVYVIGLIVSDSLVKSYPSWDTQASITDFGRNIRQLPCVSRRTGETGVCMFAYSCAKANGTHLGTCIDRFYFGSCCKAPADGDLDANEPADNYLNTNNVDNEVAGPPPSSTTVKTVRPGGQQSGAATTAQQQYSPTATTSYPSSSSSSSSPSSSPYRPTAQFAVSSPSASPTASATTSRYAETSNGTRPPSTVATGRPGLVTSTYSTTVGQSAATSASYSTVKPSVKPGSYRPPPPPSPSREPATSTAATAQKTTKPAPKPTAQFGVAGSTAPASTYTSVSPPRPLGSDVTAAFSTAKPVVKPSGAATYKPAPAAAAATSASPPPTKARPQTTAKPTAARPKPSSARPTDPSAPSTVQPAAGSSYTTRSTVEYVNLTAVKPTTAAAVPSDSAAHTAFTSTSPTLVTWTTLDKVPATPPENARPPPPPSSSPPPPPPSSPSSSATHKPSGADGSTVPSWVKLPVETHEPNTAASAPFSTATDAYSTTTASTAGPTTVQTLDNDIVMTSNSINTNNFSTHLPSTLSSTLAQTVAATTESVDDAGSAPLNMSNYKDVCGRRLFPTARIVGGEKVSFGKWPWQISLRQWRTSTYLHKCGAALFNENWAVTAAHCVENVPPSDLLLRLGEHDLSVEEEPYGYEERRIQIVASHPQFDPRTFEYDLALLRFYEPVKFQPNIIPVCVPDDDSNFVGSSAYVTGWGRLYEDGPLPSVLQEVTVPVINNSVCETMYRAAGYIEHIPDIFICAGWKKGGFDSCEGDSGGPMVIQRPDKRWLLAGIISWGIGCAEPNQPGVYTRISKFKDWINQILQF